VTTLELTRLGRRDCDSPAVRPMLTSGKPVGIDQIGLMGLRQNAVAIQEGINLRRV